MSTDSVIITGGAGYLGRGLALELMRRGVSRVCIYSRGEHRQAEARAEIGDDHRLRWMIGDVRDRERLERAMRGCDVVIHAAALKRVEVGEYNPSEMVRTNCDGAINVIDAAISAGVDRAVLVSTDKAVLPANAYGATKMVAERLFLAAPWPLVSGVIRYGNVAGSTGSVIPLWRASPDPVMTDPECTRYWITREQAVALVLDALPTISGRDLVIPTLPAYRLGDLAEAMGVRPRVVGLPASEKPHETMDGREFSDTARRMSVDELRTALETIR